MSVSASLVEQAWAVLGQTSAHSNRIACWIARAALETAVDDLLDTRQRGARGATMRSRLTVLQVACAPDDDLAARAEYAWAGLSVACHHHGFELAPGAAEVRHLIELVQTLVDDASPAA